MTDLKPIDDIYHELSEGLAMELEFKKHEFVKEEWKAKFNCVVFEIDKKKLAEIIYNWMTR